MLCVKVDLNIHDGYKLAVRRYLFVGAPFKLCYFVLFYEIQPIARMSHVNFNKLRCMFSRSQCFRACFLGIYLDCAFFGGGCSLITVLDIYKKGKLHRRMK